MCQKYTEEELDIIFSKAIPIHGMEEFGKDKRGNIILRSAYGLVDDPFGWEIDHRCLEGQDTTIDNLYPLHIRTDKIELEG